MNDMTDRMREQGYIRATEAAARVGVSVHTIYRWLERGSIMGTRVGRQHFVLTDSLRGWLGTEGEHLLKGVR